jgi:hypothetical protein
MNQSRSCIVAKRDSELFALLLYNFIHMLF